MDRRQSGAGRRTIGIIWAASLVATAIVSLLASSWMQGAWPGSPDSRGDRRRALISVMRMNLAKAAEKEKCAVIALNDEESRNYADQSRQSSAYVDRDLRSLGGLIARDGSGEERELLKKFEASWNVRRQIETALLDTATENTNMKAIELSDTISSELLQKFHDDLVKLTSRVTPPTRRTEMDKSAGQAEVAALNLALLQKRHINAPTEADKIAIETAIKAAEQKADSALKSLETMSGKKTGPFMKGALSDFSQFMQVGEEIVRLSRINSNRSAIETSLGRKRLADAECDRELKALQASGTGLIK